MGGPGFPSQPRPYLTAIPTPGADPVADSRLPRYRTSFVGREAELREVVRLLVDPRTRWLTLTGRSGVGKTRLAVEACADPAVAARGEAVLVDVALARDAGDVAVLLAEALETARLPGQAPEEAIRRRLRHAPAVVVADDVDRVEGAAAVLLDLLSASAGSVVIATAHRPLHVPRERVVRLDRFDLPPADRQTPRALLENPAVALYADRAAAVDPGFRLSRSNVEDVAELVRRLDGLPLLIELGAARAHILSPRAQLEALRQHSALDLRGRRAATGPERHGDVRSAVAVSYAAASDAARVVLRRMSVAADAATSDRIRGLILDPGWTLAEVIDALAELVDLGLADVDRRTDGEPRFRLHPTVAAFGLERLDAEDDRPGVEARYADAVRADARATRELPHARRIRALAEASAELHAVFGLLADAGDVEAALELAADLGPLWAYRGLFQGPGTTFERLLEAAESGAAHVAPGVLAGAQLWWTRLVIHGASPSAHRDRVVSRLATAVDAARATGDDQLLLFGLDTAAWSVFVTGDYAATDAAVAEGLAVAERLGDRVQLRRFRYCAAMLANFGGDVSTALGLAGPALDSALRDRDLIDTIRVCSVLWTVPAGTPGLPANIPSAEALLDACLAAGELVEASLLYTALTGQATRRGAAVEAARWAMRGLELAQQLGAWYAGGMTTAALVLLAGDARDAETVARLHGSLVPVLSEVLVGLGPYGPAYHAAIAAAREQLGSATFDRVVADASILDRDVAIDRAAAYASSVLEASGTPPVEAVPADASSARSHGPLSIPQPETPDRPEHLTPREVEVLRALMTGATNGAIAKSLGLRPKTVMHHSVSIYAKLGVRGRTEAVAWAFRRGIRPDGEDEPIPEQAAAS